METVEKKTYEPFRRVVRFHSANTDAKIEILFSADGRLSMSGDCREGGRYGGSSAGQCYDDILKHFPKRSKRLVEIWKRWHLNDMRAGCEHQRLHWHPEEILGFVEYRLTSDALKKQQELRDRAIADAQMDRSEKSSFNKRERELLNAPICVTYSSEIELPTNLKALYEVKESKTNTAGWTYPKDHPRGLLTKPCEVCGYKYGSEWLFEEVPDDVINELRQLKEGY